MRTFWKPYLPVLCLILVLAGSASVLAQSSAGYDLSWHVIGGGGGASASAGYRVQGTVGQPLVVPPAANSAGFQAAGGYWVVGASTPTVAPTSTVAPAPTVTPTATPYRSFLPNISR